MSFPSSDHPRPLVTVCYPPMFTGDLVSWRAAVADLDASGVGALCVPDHLMTPNGIDPIAALGFLAAATHQARLWSLVLCNDFRHPAVVYRAAVTLDQLSAGRLSLGMGAGWLAEEYAAAGLPFDPAATRLSRLAESVRLLREAFERGTVTHEGSHYRLSGFGGGLRAVQRPHPPIVMGGGGRMALRSAGRLAQIVCLNPDRAREPLTDLLPDRVEERLSWVAEGLGRAPHGRLDLFTSVYETHVVADRREAEECRAGIAARRGVTPQVVRDSLGVWVGTPEECLDLGHERRERFGMSCMFLGKIDGVEPAALRRLLRLVADA